MGRSYASVFLCRWEGGLGTFCSCYIPSRYWKKGDILWSNVEFIQTKNHLFFRYSAFLSCFSSLMLNGSQDLQPTYLLKLSMLPSLVWLNQQWLELLDISGRGVEWKCSSLLVSKVGSAGLTGSRKISGSASEIIYLEEIKKIRKKYK